MNLNVGAEDIVIYLVYNYAPCKTVFNVGDKLLWTTRMVYLKFFFPRSFRRILRVNNLKTVASIQSLNPCVCQSSAKSFFSLHLHRNNVLLSLLKHFVRQYIDL